MIVKNLSLKYLCNCFHRIPEGKAPHFLQKPTIKQEQKLLIMTCLLEAKPTPQIRWFRDQTEVGEGGRFTISLQRDPSAADTYTATLQIKVRYHFLGVLVYCSPAVVPTWSEI